MPRPRAPAGFVTIGNEIFVSLGHLGAAALQPNDSAPNVILIFGWMGALTRHLLSYSRKYSELYPQATQIIVKCPPSFFWNSERGQENRLLPVAEALEALGCLPPARIHLPPRVLVHSFSNGGAHQVVSLGRLLSSKYPSLRPPEPLPSALILDSAPAISGFRSMGLAFRIAIQNPVVRYAALTFVYVLHALHLSIQAIFGIETKGTRFVKALLDPRVLPWMDAQTPRLYVFSKKDAVVSWRAVEGHAEVSRLAGLDVRCEVYEESAHVAHMRLDPERYWASIRKVWEDACRVGVQESPSGK